MYERDVFREGRPSSITTHPEYRFEYSVSVGIGLDLEILEPLAGQLPEGAATLAIAVLADGEHLRVEDDPPVRTLHLPETGPSDVARFTIRGLRPGAGSLNVFVYHKGCLVMRAYASAPVGEGTPTIGDHERRTTTAPILSPDKDVAAAIGSIDEQLRASLLIECDRVRNKLAFVLFAEHADRYTFESATVPAGNAMIGFPKLRKALRELIGMRRIPFDLVFQSVSVDLTRKPDVRNRALKLLYDAARTLDGDLFGDPGAERLRLALDKLLREDDTPGILQVVSDDVFVPWQLLYFDDGEQQIDPMRFWGMRLQIRQSAASGDGLRWGTMKTTEGPIAFVNRTLPRLAVSRHDQFLPTWTGTEIRYTETDVLDDLRTSNNRRPAVYFFCHASFSASDLDDVWIALTASSRLTLDQLRDTRVDRKTKRQIVFEAGPLIFLNACESGQIDSAFYRSFVGFFLHDKKAGAVLGTETEMPAYFATDFADRFWRKVATTPTPLGQLLLELRLDYWHTNNNPLALLYTLYANGDSQRR